MRIWFNRGFSLAAIAKAMMNGNPGLEVIVSISPDAPVRSGPTMTLVEPSCDDAEYTDWVYEQITTHSVDVFVPTRRRTLFDVNLLHCAVHLPTSVTNLDILEDKLAFAKAMVGQAFYLETFGAETSAELTSLLAMFNRTYPERTPCVKPRFGVNGHGFWKLTHGSAFSHLIDPDQRDIRQDIFLQSLETLEKTSVMPSLVLMEFLPGPEVSFDVLAHDGKILKYVARTKQADRQHLQSRHPLEEQARMLVDVFELHGLVNIQFRMARDGSWKVLEINARPAGGSIYAEQFGSRLISDWGGLLAGTLTPEQVTPIDIDIEVEMITTLRPITKENA